MITLGNRLNAFCVNTKRHKGVMVNQHIEINANFENVDLFIKTINHEYNHVILNSIIDTTCKVSMMFDNIDSYENGYKVSWK